MATPSKEEITDLLWDIEDLKPSVSEKGSDFMAENLMTTLPSSVRDLCFESSLQTTQHDESKPGLKVTSFGLLLCGVFITVKSDTSEVRDSIIQTLNDYLHRAVNFDRSKSTIPLKMCSPVSYLNFVLKHCQLFTSDGTVEEDVLNVWIQLATPISQWLHSACIDHIKSSTEWRLLLPKPCNIDKVKEAVEEKQHQIYEKFHNYEFDYDMKFQGGLQSILSAIHSSTGDTNAILQAKLFYYTRFHHPVTSDGYEDWLSKTKSVVSGDVAKPQSGVKGQISEITTTDTAASVSNTSHEDHMESTSDDSGPQYPTSFFDIIKKIEKGEPLPGVKDLNIQPTNTQPLESAMESKPKPWQQ